jgi:hypothetical protein
VREQHLLEVLELNKHQHYTAAIVCGFALPGSPKQPAGTQQAPGLSHVGGVASQQLPPLLLTHLPACLLLPACVHT